MARTWLINSRGLATKVRNATCSPAHQIKDCGANRECPKCHYRIDNSDVSTEWPGLPLGVKFDPSDVELLEHLAAKCGAGNSKEHLFIDEFIPTLNEDQGICYTHPENLPGAKRDGSSVHFFHRTMNAYASGHRKRRKIHSQHSLTMEHVRWHKTGKTKPVMENGLQKGFKKIMVLYKSSKKGSKPDKYSWVMHQYHLGTEKEENEGEFVVSKIFYQQPKQSDNNDSGPVVEDSDTMTLQNTPRTPKVNPPNPPRPGKSVLRDDVADSNLLLSSAQEAEYVYEAFLAPPPDTKTEDYMEYPAWLAGESQAFDNSDLNCMDDLLLCKEVLDSCAPLNHSGTNHTSYADLFSNRIEASGNNNVSPEIADLANIELDTPPDFSLSKCGCRLRMSVLLGSDTFRNLMFLRDVSPNPIWSNVTSIPCRDNLLFSSHAPLNPFMVWSCSMSTSKGRSMRSKVERRMQRESGKTLREKRRAQKLKKKLMTEEERLIYNLKRAKKKVALLLQKLKKYELPELPPPRHDPELLTPEQLQAFKKVGFRNRNYVPVGVRGVFGGVVQNMHLHWKFHETVQVCCDNFPKEKIKEMATMLARLSGGIVINIHNTKTIIMFRGRNYRQPKNLIPINTLTKRKALFKARFEQALESQKLNIKKMEQQLRRMGVNPEDPVAMASIRKVASTFFNAIDRKEGSPYVFREEKQQVTVTPENWEEAEPPVDSDQEELDRFIAEIEDAADKEWVAEEAAEKEELSKIRYWNREEFGGRFRRSETPRANSYDDDDEVRGTRGWKETRVKPRTNDTDDEDIDNSDGEDEWDSNDVRDAVDVESDSDDSHQVHDKVRVSRANRWKEDKIYGAKNNGSSKRNPEANFRRERTEEESDSESMLSDLENATWQSDAEEEHDSEPSRAVSNNYRSSSDEEEDFYHIKGNEKKGDKDESGADKSYETRGRYNGSSVAQKKHNRTGEANNYERFQRKDAADFRGKTAEKESGSEDMLSDLENAMWESDVEDDPRAPTAERYSPGDEENHHQMEDEKYGADNKKKRTRKAADEAWDSD